MKQISLVVIAVSLAFVSVRRPSVEAPTARTQDPAAALGPPAPDDPALLRKLLLDRMDARIDAIATQTRLELRLALDDIYPLSFLGVDSHTEDGRLVLNAVYAGTGAEEAGLRVGDVLRSLASTPVASREALARAVRAHRVGETVDLAVERDGERLVLHAVLGARPEEDEDFEEQFPDLFAATPPRPRALTLAFDGERPGELPERLVSVLGGHGREGLWRLTPGEPGLSLSQLDDDPTGIRFAMVLVRDWEDGDVVVRVRFRYLGGLNDRTAGVVLRYRDPGNYLVARANSGEKDLRIFRVANGDRRTLPGGRVEVESSDEGWHVLEFRAEGPKLTATLDGNATATAYDSYFLRGRVGLWTKSDATTEFDDLVLEPLP